MSLGTPHSQCVRIDIRPPSASRERFDIVDFARMMGIDVLAT
jgi:hypothetical protein